MLIDNSFSLFCYIYRVNVMRLFIALELSDSTKDVIQVLQTAIGKDVSGRSSPKENLHLTLAFLGEVENPKPVIQVLKNMESRHEKFSLSFDRLEVFPSRKSQTLVLCPSQKDIVTTIARHLREGLKRAGIVFDPKPFYPHITLARNVPCVSKPPKAVEPILETFDSFCLFRSELKKDSSPKYTAIERFCL